MTNIDPTPYGGTYITISERAATVPLHALAVAPGRVIQFPDAASLVAYARANYDAQRAR